MNIILSAFILFDQRCRCKEKISITKKRKPNSRSEKRAFLYFYPDKELDMNLNQILISKTFQIKYEKTLSSLAKNLLNTFQKKYLYHAIDDTLDFFKSNFKERKNLLAILYSPVLLLHNNFSINFFDIFIDKIDINEMSKTNKFLQGKNYPLKSVTYITIKLLYRRPAPIKKQESLW